jgi:hypothetical protein
MKTALCTAATMLICSGPPASSAPPGYVVTLEQVGSNVVATGSGAIDLTGLVFLFSSSGGVGLLSPNNGELAIGSGVEGFYAGLVSGPANFGSGGLTRSSSNTGVPVEIFSPVVVVPAGYVSGSPLSDTSTYLSQTFSSLGATPGKVPEPSTWAMMIAGFGLLGVLGYRKTRRALA